MIAVAEFGQRRNGLQDFCRYRAIPSHDTFWRLFRCLDGAQFEAYFLRWVAEVAELNEGEVVAGKSVRRSHDRSKAERNHVGECLGDRLTLGQVQVAANEITAIPQLLRALETGCIITIDAIGCQKEITGSGEADYVLAAESRLHEDVTFLFEDLCESKFTAFAYSSRG